MAQLASSVALVVLAASAVTPEVAAGAAMSFLVQVSGSTIQATSSVAMVLSAAMLVRAGSRASQVLMAPRTGFMAASAATAAAAVPVAALATACLAQVALAVMPATVVRALTAAAETAASAVTAATVAMPEP
jgi:hypothetical protein